MCCVLYFIFFFNDTATTEIYTLSLHDALPICPLLEFPDALLQALICFQENSASLVWFVFTERWDQLRRDRKSTRLNSSHANISYAVFCLKKNKSMTTTSRDVVTVLLHADA